MAGPSSTQVRLLYSLLKPAVRIAARFRIPIRTAGELLRLAYFEDLRRSGLSHAEIARRLGQTERNMRMLERKLKSEFFTAESEVGLVREVEDAVALHRPSQAELLRQLTSWDPDEVLRAVEVLVDEGRIETLKQRLVPTHRYAQLTSEKFHQRIDALNHFLDAITRAIVQRLVFDESRDAMVKTISFDASRKAFRKFRTRFERELRSEIRTLEKSANAKDAVRYVLGLNVARRED